jgi:hypothetical protein
MNSTSVIRSPNDFRAQGFSQSQPSWSDFSNSPFAQATGFQAEQTFQFDHEDSGMELCEKEQPGDGLLDFIGPVIDEGSAPLVNFLQSITREEPTEILDGLNIMKGKFDAKMLLDFVKTRNVQQFLVVIKRTMGNLAHLETFISMISKHPMLSRNCIVILAHLEEDVKAEVFDVAQDIGFNDIVEHAAKGVDDFMSQMLCSFGFGELISKDKYDDWKIIWNLYAGKRLEVTVFKGKDSLTDNNIRINLI